MDCNTKCYWNYDGMCVYEDAEKFDNGKPNSVSCPNFLIHDFEKQFWDIYNNIKLLIDKRNFKELKEIEKFIINQRKGDNHEN